MFKEIELKMVDLAMPGEDGTNSFSYKNQILNLLRLPMDLSTGMSSVQLLEVTPIMTLVSECADGEMLLLKEAQHEVLLARLHAFCFPFAHEEFAKFILHLQDAKYAAPKKSK